LKLLDTNILLARANAASSFRRTPMAFRDRSPNAIVHFLKRLGPASITRRAEHDAVNIR
jgi:hypothetical protein